MVLPLYLDPIAERNLSAKFWINWKVFRGRTALLFFPHMCNALQHMLKQRNTTDDFFDVVHVSDFEIYEIEEDKEFLIAQKENGNFVELVEH